MESQLLLLFKYVLSLGPGLGCLNAPSEAISGFQGLRLFVTTSRHLTGLGFRKYKRLQYHPPPPPPSPRKINTPTAPEIKEPIRTPNRALNWVFATFFEGVVLL